MANKILIPAPDVKDIVIALKERYPINLQYVNVEKIDFWRDMVPKKGKKRVFAYVRRCSDEEIVKDPTKLWIMTVNATHFDPLMPAHQHAVVFHESQHIGPLKETEHVAEEPTTYDHDIKEFYVVLATLGLDYLHNDMCVDLLGPNSVELKVKQVDEEDVEDEANFQ
jgi:predicted metallopeptidase